MVAAYTAGQVAARASQGDAQRPQRRVEPGGALGVGADAQRDLRLDAVVRRLGRPATAAQLVDRDEQTGAEQRTARRGHRRRRRARCRGCAAAAAVAAPATRPRQRAVAGRDDAGEGPGRHGGRRQRRRRPGPRPTASSGMTSSQFG